MAKYRRLLPAVFVVGLGVVGSGFVIAGEDTKVAAEHSHQAHQTVDAGQVARGRELVVNGGCNDCHTAGYPEAEGKIPETEWLTGSPTAFTGTWGSSYAVNLRTLAAGLTEEQWVLRVKSIVAQPPMPWFALHAESDADLGAIHAYIKSLGAKGSEMPAASK